MRILVVALTAVLTTAALAIGAAPAGAVCDGTCFDGVLEFVAEQETLGGSCLPLPAFWDC